MNNRITQINNVLTVKEDLFLPQIDEKAEYPQKFFNVTDNEIDEYRQLKIQREQDAANAKKATKKKGRAAQAEEEAAAAEKERLAKEAADKSKPVEVKLKPKPRIARGCPSRSSRSSRTPRRPSQRRPTARTWRR